MTSSRKSTPATLPEPVRNVLSGSAGGRLQRQAGRSSSLESVKKSLRFLNVLPPRGSRTVAELLQALGEAQPQERRAQRSQQRAAQRQLDVLVDLGLAEVVQASRGLPTTYRLGEKANPCDKLGHARTYAPMSG